jgi:hypothetical protein
VAALFIVCASSITRARDWTHYDVMDYSLTLPDDWVLLPFEVLESLNLVQGGGPDARVKFVAAFQPKSVANRTGGRAYPIVGVQRMTYRVEPMEQKAEVRGVDEDGLRKFADRYAELSIQSRHAGAEPNEARYDRLFTKLDPPSFGVDTYFPQKGGGELHCRTIGMIGREATLICTFHVPQSEWATFEPLITRMLASFAMSPGKLASLRGIRRDAAPPTPGVVPAATQEDTTPAAPGDQALIGIAVIVGMFVITVIGWAVIFRGKKAAPK